MNKKFKIPDFLTPVSVSTFMTFVLVCLAGVTFSTPMLARTNVKEKSVAKAARVKVQMSQADAARLSARLSTDMRFSGSKVGGQYQVPGEASARIENEKPIEALLGLRTQFRDRMNEDSERE